MKHFSQILGFVMVGVVIGWYLGYTRPVAQRQRELLQRAKFQDMESAGISLDAILCLDGGELALAKERLQLPVRRYYQLYRDGGGDARILECIQRAAQEYPTITNEILSTSDRFEWSHVGINKPNPMSIPLTPRKKK